jgi:Transglycosylase SLT domain
MIETAAYMSIPTRYPIAFAPPLSGRAVQQSRASRERRDMTLVKRIGHSVRTFTSDVAQGFFEIAHNGFAMVGLVLAFLAITMVAKPELRLQGETALIGWLQARQPVAAEVAVIESEPEAIDRATAANPKDLPKQQAAVAYWLSKKYRVAPEPISALVAEAYEVGAKTKIEPTLILAIMAIESSFNPFAQSPVGAQGLMQVMTNIHSDKYDGFGGNFAAFDPVTNLRVGVKVLQDCIARAGSVELGLRYYVGATSDATEGGYAAKVMAEQARLRAVAGGKAIPTIVPPSVTIPVIAPALRKPAALSGPEATKPALDLDRESVLLTSS